MTKKEKEAIKKKLLNYLNDKVFTGCALGISYFEEGCFVKDSFFAGSTDKEKDSPLLEERCFFDTASLTKPLVTLLSILALIKEGKIRFEDTLDTLFSKEIPDDKKSIKLIHLISHFSGLPQHKPYYKKLIKCDPDERKNEILLYILSEKLGNFPGEKYVYSDLDYILLGYIVEEKSKERLDYYWKRKITDPLQISHHFVFPEAFDENNHSNYVTTGRCLWSGKKLCGVVHDDNSRSLGGVSGHAGLFSTLEGISALSENILFQYMKEKKHQSISVDDLLYLLFKRNSEHGKYGFDTPSGKFSGSGHFFSDETIGHLGFTGTSFWIDLKKKIVIVLLTNRVIFGEDNRKIKEMRPVIHDYIMSIIER